MKTTTNNDKNFFNVFLKVNNKLTNKTSTTDNLLNIPNIEDISLKASALYFEVGK
ncbi:MAG: hypothetical protein Q8920_15170 [Bacillota bacterium]|nr:hypothetical protein [Bacillota bacterium]